MKKLVLGTLLLLSTISFSQVKMNMDPLIGYWEPDKNATQMVIWKDVYGHYQIIEFSTTSGTPLILLSMEIKEDAWYLKSLFKPTNLLSEAKYTFIDNNTLKGDILGCEGASIIYNRVK
jgi:hypothetical protein